MNGRNSVSLSSGDKRTDPPTVQSLSAGPVFFARGTIIRRTGGETEGTSPIPSFVRRSDPSLEPGLKGRKWTSIGGVSIQVPIDDRRVTGGAAPWTWSSEGVHVGRGRRVEVGHVAAHRDGWVRHDRDVETGVCCQGRVADGQRRHEGPGATAVTPTATPIGPRIRPTARAKPPRPFCTTRRLQMCVFVASSRPYDWPLAGSADYGRPARAIERKIRPYGHGYCTQSAGGARSTVCSHVQQSCEHDA